MDRETYKDIETGLNARLNEQTIRCQLTQSEEAEVRKEWAVLTFREQIVFIEAMEAQES